MSPPRVAASPRGYAGRFFVVAEVTVPDHAQNVTAALEQGHLRQEPIVGGEIAIYSELKQVMGKGEAACLAWRRLVAGWSPPTSGDAF